MDFNLRFDNQTYSDWLKLWFKESGGKQPEEFIKKLDRGVELKPFYHFSENITLQYTSDNFNEIAVSEWVDLPEEKNEHVNTLILKALNSGASGLYLNVYKKPNWELLLRDVGLEYIQTTIDFRTDFHNGYRSLEAFLSLTRNENSANKVHVVLPWFSDQETLRETLQEIQTDFHGLLIDLAEPLEAGLPPGLVLALGLEMLNTIKQIKPHLLKRIGFLTATVGNTYQDLVFNRAIKVLARAWTEKANSRTDEVYIHSRTGRTDLGSADVYNNLIRNSIKTLSAIVSGTHAVTVLPYNFFKTSADPDALRWARNQALIAIYESKLTYYSDPVAGSYALESLTQQLIDAAIEYQYEIQQYNTLSDLFTSGYYSEALIQARQNILEEYKKGGKIMVGISKYNPTAEKMEELKITFREGSPFEPFVIQNHLV
ncbi:MAG: methylmalonyl-CoA mutase family protein [Thermaurantimonas sp.]|uniref:methylmalonyl-CoA mutase family protein n=1 Tax=Thermaurantimonas sp. TaxID=2681568 RepID=UPI00391AB5A1